jgi:hypothetical protein
VQLVPCTTFECSIIHHDHWPDNQSTTNILIEERSAAKDSGAVSRRHDYTDARTAYALSMNGSCHRIVQYMNVAYSVPSLKKVLSFLSSFMFFIIKVLWWIFFYSGPSPALYPVISLGVDTVACLLQPDLINIMDYTVLDVIFL